MSHPNLYITSSKHQSLKQQIAQTHLAYLNQEETPDKLEKRRNLEAAIAEFLSLAPYDEKFTFPEFDKVFHHSVISNPNFSGYKAALAFQALEKYATNLLIHPWRREYKVIKLFSGFYRHLVQRQLPGAEVFFLLMGYSQAEDGVLFLQGPVDPDQLSHIALDCLIAFVECQIMVEVYESLRMAECTWNEIYKIRENYVAGVAECVRILQQLKLSSQRSSKNHHQLSSLDHVRKRGTKTCDSESSPQTGILVDIGNSQAYEKPDTLLSKSTSLKTHSRSWSDGPQDNFLCVDGHVARSPGRQTLGSFNDCSVSNFYPRVSRATQVPQNQVCGYSHNISLEQNHDSWDLLSTPGHWNSGPVIYPTSHFPGLHPGVSYPYGPVHHCSCHLCYLPTPVPSHRLILERPFYEDLGQNGSSQLRQGQDQHKSIFTTANTPHTVNRSENIYTDYDRPSVPTSELLDSLMDLTVEPQESQEPLQLNDASDAQVLLPYKKDFHNSENFPGRKVDKLWDKDKQTIVDTSSEKIENLPKGENQMLQQIFSIPHQNYGNVSNQKIPKDSSSRNGENTVCGNVSMRDGQKDDYRSGREIKRREGNISGSNSSRGQDRCMDQQKRNSLYDNVQPDNPIQTTTETGDQLLHPAGLVVPSGVKMEENEIIYLKKTASNKETSIKTKKWSCQACTYLNPSEKDICEICSRSKFRGAESTPLVSGGRECPLCTLVNEMNAEYCSVCDTYLEDCPTYI
ncbi:PUB and ZnF_RBZ domain-containing protein tamozhennic isoform X1 [Tachypleus tridentatus]|uniref:PUB and ZnF_RBZ domain-containing protein tamozhennic isoform X1 n=1 Tax=Tachypleus tridentatus TaxID=6853 RepID=UPI003FD1C221